MRVFFRQLFCWHAWSEWFTLGHAFWSVCIKGCGAHRCRM